MSWRYHSGEIDNHDWGLFWFRQFTCLGIVLTVGATCFGGPVLCYFLSIPDVNGDTNYSSNPSHLEVQGTPATPIQSIYKLD